MSLKIRSTQQTDMYRNDFTIKNDEDWLLKIDQSGKISFNGKLKLNADEFARKFIDIVEETTERRKQIERNFR